MTPAPSPQRFECASAGVRLVGEQWGTPGRGMVVLLHGGGQTRHSWKRTAERIAAGGWAAVTYDARGHGDSDWDADENYTLDALVADLLAVVRMQPHPLVFVGASLGGITSLIATAENPGLASGLVLIDIVVELEPRGTARMVDFLTAHRDGFASLAEVADAISAYNPHRPRPRNLDGLHKNVRLRSDGRWYWHWDPAFIKIGDEPRRQADPQRLRAAAANVRVPTLLVRGADSDVVTDTGIEDMKRLIPTAESIVVQDAGHMVAGDDNALFVVGLERFLDRVE